LILPEFKDKITRLHNERAPIEPVQPAVQRMVGEAFGI